MNQDPDTAGEQPKRRGRNVLRIIGEISLLLLGVVALLPMWILSLGSAGIVEYFAPVVFQIILAVLVGVGGPFFILWLLAGRSVRPRDTVDVPVYLGRIGFTFVWHAVLVVPLLQIWIGLGDKKVGIGVPSDELETAAQEVQTAERYVAIFWSVWFVVGLLIAMSIRGDKADQRPNKPSDSELTSAAL